MLQTKQFVCHLSEFTTIVTINRIVVVMKMKKKIEQEIVFYSLLSITVEVAVIRVAINDLLHYFL